MFTTVVNVETYIICFYLTLDLCHCEADVLSNFLNTCKQSALLQAMNDIKHNLKTKGKTAKTKMEGIHFKFLTYVKYQYQ